MSKNADEIPLRERKFARSRLALLDAAIERLQHETFDEIKIRDLCRQAQVSEATFYNYFPKKTDLLYYFIQLWGIEVLHHATCVVKTKTALGAIEAIFAYTGKRIEEGPVLMGEIIAFQARIREKPTIEEITKAERILAFPGREGIEEIPARGLEYILPHFIKMAVSQGELPPGTDQGAAMIALASLFFGVPLMLGMRGKLKGVGDMYQKELTVLWKGLEARVRKRRKI